MIDRFNFFDVYGYLLPGGLLLALFWLPFGLVLGKWPPADWGSAALALALAYVCGHLLRNFAEAAFSSKFKDHQVPPVRRYPSDLLLDVNGFAVLGTGFANDLRDRLGAQILQKFGANVEADAQQWTEQLERRRNGAFFSCRAYLIAQKAAAYAEQQQGMYELCRGIAAALAMASAYFLGLGLGFSAHSRKICGYPFVCVFLLLLGLFGIGALISAVYSMRRNSQEKARRWGFYLCAAILACGAAAVATADHHGPLVRFVPDRDHHITMVMCVLAAASLILALYCVGLFRTFAVSFAKVVYQDFNTLVSTAPQAPPGPAPALGPAPAPGPNEAINSA